MEHAEKVRAKWEAQPKNRVHGKKTTTKFKTANNNARKLSRAEVNTILGKFKQKLDKEQNKNELNVMANAIKKAIDDKLEEVLNEVVNEE